MDKIKGFNESSDLQQQKSILIDIGLIIEFNLRDYREYLQTLFYEPMSIKMNKFIRQLHDMSDEQIEFILQKL